ncbi:MAG: HU family DNA-binding protein [Candidatus Kapaibacterium sp.]
MNAQSLINKSRIKSSFSKELSENIFRFLFEEIRRIVKEQKHVSISDIGDFSVVHRKMQTRTDEGGRVEILLPPKDKVIYKPSESLINRMKNDD